MSNPIYDQGAEDVVIAAVLMEGLCRLPDGVTLDDSDFTEANGIVFKTAQTLAREGQIPDLVSITTRLQTKGLLDRAGGAARLSAVANVGYHGTLLATACQRVSEL